MIGRRATKDLARGVDLNLNQFDLSEPTRITQPGTSGSWRAMLDSDVTVSDTFWSSIKDGNDSIEDKDMSLLRNIFNPHLSDRRDEGDHFVPPGTDSSYVEKLRDLVKEEETMQSMRREQFFGKDFKVDKPGSLFPASWTPAWRIACKESTKGLDSVSRSSLCPRPEYCAQVTILKRVIKASTPTFDKYTEDGIRFRIYKAGSIEVRTTQEHDGEEVIGAVFSVGSAAEGEQQKQSISDDDRIVRVTEYVEGASKQPTSWISYIVFQTESGNTIVTETNENGTVIWDENPANLEARNALAAVVRSADCRNVVHDVQAGTVKSDLIKESVFMEGSCQQKHYVQNAYSRVCGDQEAKVAKVPRRRRLDKFFDFKAQQRKQQGKATKS